MRLLYVLVHTTIYKYSDLQTIKLTGYSSTLGTKKERGLIGWEECLKDSEGNNLNTASIECYDLPWCLKRLNRVEFLKYIPFCPAFDFSCKRACCACCGKDEVTLEQAKENPAFSSIESSL